MRQNATPILLSVCLTATAVTGLIAARASAAPTAFVTVDAAHTIATVNSTQFGHIVEDINHSVEGGLNANVVRNANMKENGISSWSVLTTGGATGSVALDTSTPLNSANPNSLRLNIGANSGAQRAGVANAGFYGVGIRPSSTYSVSFFARADQAFGPLTVTLESNTGTVYATATVSGPSTTWAKYTATLTTSATAPVSTANRFVISANGTGAGRTLWLNVVQCNAPTFASTGNIRADLQQKLADTNPGFFRVPGGNYLEGLVLANRFAWKKTIGPVETRAGHQNDAWGYWSTDHFGILNYLLMAEQAGAEPILGVFAGYTLDGTEVPQSQLAPYVQEALDQIEYVIGPATSTWGARRVADGHTAPFPLRYLEIGNEDWFDNSGSYNAYRYPMFYDAIKAAYPQLQIVASMPVTSRPMDVIDDHYYNNNPAGIVSLASRYDNADRNGPKVLIGEFGVTNGSAANPTGTLSGAVAEAAFMTGTLRNADHVIGAAYAPALTSVDNWQWSSNLIGFNAVSSFGSPSYHVQKMFGTLLGDHVSPVQLTGSTSGLYTTATRTTSGIVYLTVVNTNTAAVETQVAVTGATSVSGTATMTTLTGDPNARNSITAPNTIVPTTVSIAAGASFVRTFPASSVTVIQLSTTSTASPLLPMGKGTSLRATTPGYTDRSVRHQSGVAVTSVISATSPAADKQDATLFTRPGLAGSGCYSFESRNNPGSFLRHFNYQVLLAANDGSALFAADATFCASDGHTGQGISLRSYNFATRYLRHHNSQLWIASNGGSLPSDTTTNWAADTTWRVGSAWWRSDANVTAGSYQSLQASNASGNFVRHQGYLGFLAQVTAASSATTKQDATFRIVPGLAESSCYSFESRNFPGYFLRHADYRVRLDARSADPLYLADATFCAQPGNSGTGISWQSYNFANRYLRHFNSEMWIASNGGPTAPDTSANFPADTSWLTSSPWAP